MKSLVPLILLFCSVYANAAGGPQAAQQAPPQPLPKGCIRSFDDLKSADAKDTVAQLDFVANPATQKQKVNGWNQLMGDWTLAIPDEKTASAIFAIENDGLSGKIISKISKTGVVTGEQSGKLAICNNGGRLELWMLDASREKGSPVVMLMRSRVADRIDFVPLTGEYKDTPLPFQKGKIDATAVAKGAPAGR